MRKISIFIVLCTLVFLACKKWEDKAAVPDDRINNPYCNNPDAVNYNWGFPGIPVDSVCIYPVTAFKGTFLFQDSVFLGDNAFAFGKFDTLYIYALSNTKIAVVGFCGTGDSLYLTTNRSFVATADSTAGIAGQLLCRVQDTVIGTISKNQQDTTTNLQVNLAFYSDTGTTFHIGTAIKL